AGLTRRGQAYVASWAWSCLEFWRRPGLWERAAYPGPGRAWSGRRSAEAVELAAPGARQERVPLGRGEPEHRSGGVLAGPDADPAVGQAGHLDAGAVGVAERALPPAQALLSTVDRRVPLSFLGASPARTLLTECHQMATIATATVRVQGGVTANLWAICRL